jgi:putative cardiolipin synthase
MGFVIDSPALARRVHDAFDQGVPEDAYRVMLTGDGKLAWEEKQEGGTVRHDVEPGTTAWQRFMVWLLSLLPIDALL